MKPLRFGASEPAGRLFRALAAALFWAASIGTAGAATISGFIYGAGNGEALSYANVRLQGTRMGAITNHQGHFVIPGVPAGSYELIAGFIGYRPETRRIDLREEDDLSLVIELEPQAVTLEGIEIQAETREPSVSPSKLAMHSKELVQVPPAVELDLFRAVQALPGVTTLSDYSSGLYVQGGSPDQNLILLDDVDVYNPSHLFGFFSTFNVDAVKTVELRKSGYPAPFGGRLSSVLDVQNRDGNRKEFEGVGRLSIISASTTLEGPWKRGSWMLSGRHTYIEPLARAMDIDLPYKFYDLQGKVNFDPAPSERTSLSGYLGRDKLDWDRPGLSVYLDWGNEAVSAHWTHLFSTRLFSQFVVGHSRFDSRGTIAFRDFAFRMHNQVSDLALKGNLSYAPSTEHRLTFGGEAKFLTFDFERSAGEEDRLHFRYDGVYGATYLEDDWELSDDWELQGGLRLDYYSEGDWFKLGPRLSLRRRINEISSWHLGYGRYTQFLNLVTAEGASFADMWFPVDRGVPPGIANHVVAGYQVRAYEGLDLSLEGYYKPYSNLVEFSEEFTRSLVEQDATLDQLFNSGTGRAYGADLYLRNNLAGFEGWLGYSYGVTRKKIEGYNFDREYSPSYDRRHQFVLMQDRVLAGDWKLNIAFRYGSGQPLTLATGRYTVRDVTGRRHDVVLEGEKNSFRLPPYHRLDLGISRPYHYRGLIIEPTVQIINLYNRKNVYLRSYDTTLNPAQYDDVSMLPLLPTVGVSVRF